MVLQQFSKMAITYILLVVFFLGGAAPSQSAGTTHICYFSDDAPEWQVTVPVMQPGELTAFQCYHPTDTLTPSNTGYTFSVRPDGRCDESKAVLLSDIIPTAELGVNSLGGGYSFRTAVLPYNGPKTVCYVCSGDPGHNIFKGKKCFLFLQVAQAEVTSESPSGYVRSRPRLFSRAGGRICSGVQGC